MNVKLSVLSAGVLFFFGGQIMFAQETKAKKDTLEKQIEEVVILGYSKTSSKPKDNTATVTISGERLENRPNSSFLSSLQGEVAGLSVNTTSGSPGSAKIDLIIRGVSSINSQSDPLFVIDGMISNAVQYRNINPNDIESMSFLKDAGATSIYGNRGANGVVIIKTKSAKFGNRFGVTYNGTIGISTLPQTKYDLANSQQLLTIQRAAGQGQGVGMTDAQIAGYTTNTDWKKVLFRQGITQNHDVAMSFGGENIANYTSFGYMNQEGVVPTTDFQRFTLRNNFNGKSKNERFTFGSNLGVAFSKRHQLDQETSTTIDANVVQNPLLVGITALPTLASGQFNSGQDLFNTIGSDFGNGKNVYVLEDVLKGTLPNELTETSILTNFNASYKLTDELTISNRSGVDYKYGTRTFARTPQSYLAIVVAANAATAGVPNPFGGSESMTKTNEFNFNSVTSLNFHKVFNEDHTVDAGAYFDYVKTHYSATGQTQNGLNPLNYVFGAGTGYVPFDVNNPTFYRPTISASKVTAGTLAYFGSLDYDYKGKYGIGGVVRRDASYRFVGDYKWATFWSVSGRWNVDQENFMEGSGFDMLKLRGSYGTQGNQMIVAAAYGTNPLLVGTNLVRNTNTVGLGYNNINGAYYTSVIGNPNAQWEEISQFNVGLDFKTLKGRLEGTFDYYKKKTDKLYNDINLSAITSLYGINGNNGSMQNEGVEGMLRYTILKNENARITVFANAAYNKSKILSLVKGDETGIVRNVVGGQLAEWTMLRYAGVNASNGNLLFLDKDGNLTEDPNPNTDAVATGKNYLPKWTGGFGFNSEYKGFFLDVNFSFQQGAWRYDNQMDYVYDPTTVAGYNVSSNLLNAWTPTNTSTNIPSLSASNSALSGSSDRFLRDASFVRLKNVVLGYSLPKTVLENTGIKGAKLFVQAENLLTWTKWKGYDPEPVFSVSTSVYPNVRTISLGASVDF